MVEMTMSKPLDLSQFPDLPPEVVKAFEAQKFELAVERAARLHHQAEAEEKGALVVTLTARDCAEFCALAW